MKFTFSILIIAVLAVSAACEKELVPAPVSFDVTVTDHDYQVGDTITFRISGNPDMITFYPGEPGANYDFATNEDPDRGVPIKDISERLESFSYIYSDPGVYKAVFVAINAAGTKRESALKQIDLTIR